MDWIRVNNLFFFTWGIWGQSCKLETLRPSQKNTGSSFSPSLFLPFPPPYLPPPLPFSIYLFKCLSSLSFSLSLFPSSLFYLLVQMSFLSLSSPLPFSIYFSKCLFLSLSFPSPFLSTYLSKSLSLSSVKAVLNSVSSSGIATRKAMRGKPKTRLVRDAKLLVSGSCMSQVWRLNKCNFVASHLWWTQSMITFYIN